MKPTTSVLAIFSIIFFLDSCTSPGTSTVDNMQTLEGGSSHDTINFTPITNERALVIQGFSREGGSSHDTIYLEANRSAKIYTIRGWTRKKKP